MNEITPASASGPSPFAGSDGFERSQVRSFIEEVVEEDLEAALGGGRCERGSFHRVVDLQAAIHRYIAEHNNDPKPFTWSKPAHQILAKVNDLNASAH